MLTCQRGEKSGELFLNAGGWTEDILRANIATAEPSVDVSRSCLIIVPSLASTTIVSLDIRLMSGNSFSLYSPSLLPLHGDTTETYISMCVQIDRHTERNKEKRNWSDRCADIQREEKWEGVKQKQTKKVFKNWHMQTGREKDAKTGVYTKKKPRQRNRDKEVRNRQNLYAQKNRERSTDRKKTDCQTNKRTLRQINSAPVTFRTA